MAANIDLEKRNYRDVIEIIKDYDDLPVVFYYPNQPPSSIYAFVK